MSGKTDATDNIDRAVVEYMLSHERGCPFNRSRFIEASAAYQLATGYWAPTWAEAPASVRSELRVIAELDGRTIGDLARAWLKIRLKQIEADTE